MEQSLAVNNSIIKKHANLIQVPIRYIFTWLKQIY